MEFEQPKEFTITPMNVNEPSVAQIVPDIDLNHQFILFYVDKNGQYKMKTKDNNRAQILEMIEVNKRVIIDSYIQK